MFNSLSGSPFTERQLLNPLTLSFHESELEKAYQNHNFAATLPLTRAIHVITIIIYITFGAVDILAAKDMRLPLILLRFGIVIPLLLAGLASTFHPAYARYRHFEIHFMMFIMIASLILVRFTLVPALAFLYQDGLIIIILFSYIVLFSRTIWTSLCNLLLLLFFVLIGVSQAGMENRQLVSDLVRLVLTNILGAAICYITELSNRRRFHLLSLLQLEQEKVAKINQQLEQNVKLRTAELSIVNEKLKQEISQHNITHQELIKERASLQRRVAERTADLGLANNELARALRMRNDFLANMSHELRTPLNAILGMSDILLERTRGVLDETSTRHLSIIHDSGEQLLHLINNVLDLAKIESARMELLCEDISLDMVCQASLRSIERSAQRKNIQVHYSFNTSIQQIRADPVRLKQMLVNLLDNAVKFTPESGSAGLEVNCIRNSEVIQFTVWDTGIGIKPEQMSRLFMPFVQVDSSLNRSYEGTGMGLALVARLAEIHGGSVSVESSGESGKGSRFSLWLPSIDYPYLYTQKSISELADQQDGGYPFKRALVIEDAASEANEIKTVLENIGISTSVCTQDEINSNETIKLGSDIILLDMLQPKQQGWNILNRLKTDPATVSIPLILISTVKEQVHGLSLGADAFLIKPVYPLKLQRTLRRIARSQKHLIGTQHDTVEKLTILLVDDNEATIDFLTDALESVREDYRLVTARSGLEAIERWRDTLPGAIIIDAQSQDKDGIEATYRLRRQSELVNTPIIALTAIDTTAEKERCMKAGADEFIRKPVNVKELVKLIQRLRGQASRA